MVEATYPYSYQMLLDKQPLIDASIPVCCVLYARARTLQICIVSSSICIRVFGPAHLSPRGLVSINSLKGAHAPIPSSNLPFEITSRVDAIFANRLGCLYNGQSTMVPSLIVFVSEATHVKVVQHSIISFHSMELK